MFCTQCGTELRDRDRFCSQCAHPTSVGGTARVREDRLMRDTRNGKIAGVCAGFARYLDVDVVLVRVIWVAAVVCAGVGIIPYIVAWIIVPKERVPVAAAGVLEPGLR
jgi:phage shock protein C